MSFVLEQSWGSLMASPRRHAPRAKGNGTSPPPSQQAEPVTTRAEPHYGIWFNTRRLLEPIGNIPPAEAEARYYEHGETLSLAA